MSSAVERVDRSLWPALAVAIAWAVAGPSAAAEGPPSVVASIRPIHSLAAGVMEGIGEPTLLVTGSGSPHAYSLRPSEARSLQEADVVFWVGEELETFLQRPLRVLPRKARVVALGAAPGMRLLPFREGGPLEKRAADHAHGATDMHVWLDPENARAMVSAMVVALSTVDPGNAAAYRANGERVGARLDRLSTRLAVELAPVRDRPYVVLHDAYRYFETRYGLGPAAAITGTRERRPGAKHLRRIQRVIREGRVTCVFREAGFEPALLETVIRGTPARAAVLDPLGAALADGPELYFRLLGDLGRAFRRCLAGGS